MKLLTKLNSRMLFVVVLALIVTNINTKINAMCLFACFKSKSSEPNFTTVVVAPKKNGANNAIVNTNEQTIKYLPNEELLKIRKAQLKFICERLGIFEGDAKKPEKDQK